MNEIDLRHEGAKIAREAEHPATLAAAQNDLSGALKELTPGNYAEVLRQIAATNKADIVSNPILPDLYFSTSRGHLLPDQIHAISPSQSEVASRVFNPNAQHRFGLPVAIGPDGNAQVLGNPQVTKPYDGPHGMPTPPAGSESRNARGESREAPPAPLLDQLLSLIPGMGHPGKVDKPIPKSYQPHLDAAIHNPLTTK